MKPFAALALMLLTANGFAAASASSGASVSPNGRWIAFVSNVDGNADLYAVRPDGHGLRRLTQTADEETRPAWSADSRKLVFVATGSAGRRVWLLDFKTGRVSAVPLSDTDTAPAFTPDGRLVFGSQSGALYTMRTDGSDRARIFQLDPPRPVIVHGWSHRGFVAMTVVARDRVYLATVRVSRGKIGFVTPTEDLLGESPAWSPTGEWMAFHGVQDGNVDIYVLNVFSGELRRITESSSVDAEPSWSSDEAWLAFQSDRDGSPAIFAVDLATKNVRRIVR